MNNLDGVCGGMNGDDAGLLGVGKLGFTKNMLFPLYSPEK